MTRAPKRHADALVEHPAHGQVNDAPLEAIVRELVEPLNGGEVLRVAGWLEFRVQLPQIIALEGAYRPASGH